MHSPRTTASETPAPDVAWTSRDLADDPHAAADKADRVRRMFTAIAGRYDLNNRLHSFGRDQAWRKRAVRLAAVGPDDRVLDVACGTGDLTEAFAAAGPAAVTGLDFAEAMLEVARTKAGGVRRPRGVVEPRFVAGDAMGLDFPDASFDVVSIAFGIRNVSDPAAALREFRRVLAPGGRLVILEFSRPNNPALRFANDIYTTRIMPITATILAGDRSGAYRYLPRSVASFPDRDAFVTVLEDAGFRDVEQHPMTFGVCIAYLGISSQ